MRRSNARRRPIEKIRRPRGVGFGLGKYVNDQVGGFPVPIAETVPQRGGLVSRRWEDGTRDWSENPKDRIPFFYSSPALPALLYEMRNPSGLSLLTLDQDERDVYAGAGYAWRASGYAYERGDEETTLVPVYRLFKDATDDHLFTASAAERDTAIGLGYDSEGVGFYAFSSPHARYRPVYRTYNTVSAVHYWTTNVMDVSALPATYTREGIAFYLLVTQEPTVRGSD